MRKEICLILVSLSLCLLITACSNPDREEPSSAPEEQTAVTPETSVSETSDSVLPPAAELSRREQDWLEDIEYLREQYKLLHADPFYFRSEEEFDRKLDELSERIEDLSDHDMFFELAAVMAGMGDNHTQAIPAQFIYDRYFPTGVLSIGEKLYLYGYMEGYDQLAPYLLQEIVAVNGIDIKYLQKKAESILFPTNAWESKESFHNYFFPAFFDWAGCDYQEGYTFQILNENQEVESVEIPVLSGQYDEAWVVPEMLFSIPGIQPAPGNKAAYLTGENGGCVYLSLSDLSSGSGMIYKDLFDEAAELCKAHPDCGKLVIDLRKTPGANAEALAPISIHCTHLKVPSIEHTYVLTGGMTASGAMDCISFFKKNLDAVTIGEPTGQFSSCFAYYDQPLLVLPHSQFSFWVGNQWWKGQPNENAVYDENGRLYDWENTILPDVFVCQDIEDIRQGKDSVMEWVFEQ